MMICFELNDFFIISFWFSFTSILYAISVALMPLTSLTINLYSGNIAWILVIIMLFLQNIGTQWTLVCNFVLISNVRRGNKT